MITPISRLVVWFSMRMSSESKPNKVHRVVVVDVNMNSVMLTSSIAEGLAPAPAQKPPHLALARLALAHLAGPFLALAEVTTKNAGLEHC